MATYKDVPLTDAERKRYERMFPCEICGEPMKMKCIKRVPILDDGTEGMPEVDISMDAHVCFLEGEE